MNATPTPPNSGKMKPKKSSIANCGVVTVRKLFSETDLAPDEPDASLEF